MMDASLTLHTATVQPEWIDYNGHMNEARYVEVFSEASTAFFAHLGMDADFRQKTNCSVFAIEGHIHYLHESKLGQKLHVATHLLNHDKMRIHLLHRMYQTEALRLSATFELLSVYVNQLERKITFFPGEIYEGLNQVLALHRQLDQPEKARLRF